MKRNRAVSTAIVIGVLFVAGWWIFRRGSAQTLDLLPQYGAAVKQPATGFTVAPFTLDGDTKTAVAAPANSRLTWRVKVPENGWLHVALALKPEAWTKEGDGVYFFVGASDGRSFDELFNETVNPYKNPADRRWIPVVVDLSGYAGEEIQLVFNTRVSAPGTPVDPRNDLPLWGAPEIVIR
ncbi:MAG TPA: hypothetical protein VFX12_07320 [Vicinamibacterales bacterium]|nr:hypothetical protein [Vicinamibacterales bacterium]